MSDIDGTAFGEAHKILRVNSNHVHELIHTLNYFCFSAGEELYKYLRGCNDLPGDFFEITPPEEVHEFLRCVNWSLKQAQDAVIKERLMLEERHRNERISFDAPYSFGFMIRLLTDYADTIGWTLLNRDISWVRSMYIEPHHHSDLIHHNWKSIETVISDMNNDPDQIALATDLTSFMQVGDIFLRNIRSGFAAPLEVKSGKENERLLNVFSAENVEEFRVRLQAHFDTAKNVKHSIKQIERMFKQGERAAQSNLYITSEGKKRVDLKSGMPALVVQGENSATLWSTEVLNTIEGLDEKQFTRGSVDDCLFFEYGRGKHTLFRDFDFRYGLCTILELGTEPEHLNQLQVFDLGQLTGMPAFIPQSSSLAKLGMDAQSRLLALDDYLLVHLHLPYLQFFLETKGVKLTIRNLQQKEQPFRDKLIEDIFGKNKIGSLTELGTNNGWEHVIGAGSIGRVIFNFEKPSLLADMVSQNLDVESFHQI